MIVIIDYGMGNLRSVQKAFQLFCPEVTISSSPEDIMKADKVVLPGVGAFGKAMDELNGRGLSENIKKAIESGRPFMGICLGLQLLFSESEEFGKPGGLDVFKGKVKLFKSDNGLKIPHMGWNNIAIKDKGQGIRILNDVTDNSFMYFVHSYYVEPLDRGIVLCETEYGIKFTSGVCKENVYAFQFHPEKSQKTGLKIIENFAKI